MTNNTQASDTWHATALKIPELEPLIEQLAAILAPLLILWEAVHSCSAGIKKRTLVLSYNSEMISVHSQVRYTLMANGLTFGF